MGIDVGTIIYLALAYYAGMALVLGLVLFAAGTVFTRWILPRVRDRVAGLHDWRDGPEFHARGTYAAEPGRA